LTAWAAVYDEATGLHNRTYLYDRLALECDRARRNSTSFSLIVLQVRNASRAERAAPTLSHQTLQRVAELINGITHPTDLVAMLSSSELAVLTIGVDRETRRILQERLRLAVANEVARLADDETASEVKSGAATYGADGIEASVIVQSARNAAVLGTPQRGQAAA
jgi:diguanylate cyclase (GGDEF)-like protein